MNINMKKIEERDDTDRHKMYRRTKRTARIRISYIYEHTGRMHTQRNKIRRTDRNMNISYIGCPHCILITVSYTYTYVPTVLYSRPYTVFLRFSNVFSLFHLNSRFLLRSFPFPDTTQSPLFDDVRAHLLVTYARQMSVHVAGICQY
jgi:hypothetical protein